MSSILLSLISLPFSASFPGPRRDCVKLNLFSVEPKYTNIRFCHPSTNEECERLLSHYDEVNQKNLHPTDTNIHEKVQKYSILIEEAVRHLYGSQAERYLQYDVFYKGASHPRMREIDIVNIKSPQVIEIGEIKLTSNVGLAMQNGVEQLRISSGILSSKYTKAECTIIIIDLVGQAEERRGKHIFQNYKVIRKRDGFKFKLIIISIEALFDYAAKRNITVMDDDEKDALIEETMRNVGRRLQAGIDNISKRIDALLRRISNKDISINDCNQPVPSCKSLVLSTYYNIQLPIRIR